MEPKNENLSSQAKLWSFIYGFAESLLLKCAVQLDIANIIHSHGAPMALSELSLRLPNQPVNKNALYRIMRYLVHMKLFTQSSIEGEMTYALAPPAKFLVKGWDKCMVGSILATMDEDFMAPWHHLKDGLSGRSDKTAFEKALGVDIWGYMAEHPEKSKMFNEAMANDTRVIMSALLKECTSSFEGVARLVDVGGGTGTAVRYIVEAFPGIKCTVYDLPQVIAEAPRTSEIDFVEGDMFNYIPNADAIMMKWILHDWGDKECIQILKTCKEAVPRDGGKVIIVDIVLDAESQHPYTETRLTMDLNMMLAEGKERTEVEWKKLIIHDAGYKGYKITHISALQSVIEAYPY